MENSNQPWMFDTKPDSCENPKATNYGGIANTIEILTPSITINRMNIKVQLIFFIYYQTPGSIIGKGRNQFDKNTVYTTKNILTR